MCVDVDFASFSQPVRILLSVCIFVFFECSRVYACVWVCERVCALTLTLPVSVDFRTTFCVCVHLGVCV